MGITNFWKSKKATSVKEDPLKTFAGRLRSRQGIEYRTAVVQDQRLEFVRGKDFAAYFKEHPESLTKFTSSKKLDEQTAELAQLMVRKGLLLRTDRQFKKPKPGKKRLSKWPKRLIPFHPSEQLVFSEESFYCWRYERPSSPWLWLGSILLPAGVLAMCLFPLAPYTLKIGVVYVSLGLIGLILGVLLLRMMVAGAIFILTGRGFWILPNMLSEEVGLYQAFWPLAAWEDPPDKPQYLPRLGFFAIACTSLYLLYTTAPSKGSVVGGARRAHDGIMDFLNLHEAGNLRLGNGSAENVTAGPRYNDGRPSEADINARFAKSEL